LEWLSERSEFPALLLLRRYLKLAIEIGHARNAMNTPLIEAPELPFALAAIPKAYPQPSQLRQVCFMRFQLCVLLLKPNLLPD
jgi:hypothetical protein